MLSRMFKPFLKKFWGLLISMAFVSMLSIGLLIAFATSINNLKATYSSYLDQYGMVDVQIKTAFTAREKIEDIKTVEGVDKVEERLTLDCYLKRQDNRTITARIFAFNDQTNEINKRYVLESAPKKEGAEIINVSVVRKFAENNNFKVGDSLKLGYADFYVEIYINEIIETPEAMYVRANDYILSDTRDFGFIYVSETELNEALDAFFEDLADAIENDPEFFTEIENLRDSLGFDVETLHELTGLDEETLRHITQSAVSDLANVVLAFRTVEVNDYFNQVTIRAKDGFAQEKVLENVKAYLGEKEIEIKSEAVGNKLAYRLYMENVMKQLNVATVFLPTFFYVVTMIVIGLFINQMIKTMTKDIGIMTSVGVGKWDILSIFLFFILIMGLSAGLMGLGVGQILTNLLINVMINTYSIPMLTATLNPWISVAAIAMLIVFAELATMLSGTLIFKITPKDAVISNESKRKNLPKWLEKRMDKMPVNMKLGVNAIAQNPRRFFVATFAIFAACVLILLSGFFFAAKNRLVAQTTTDRMAYDAQVYFSGKVDDEYVAEFTSQNFVTGIETGYYTYVEAKTSENGEAIYLECLALDAGKSNLVNIPTKNGRGALAIPEDGIILTTTDADRLGVKKGGTIIINEKTVTVAEVSEQYFHPITYLSKAQMTALEVQYVSSFLVNVNDENALLSFLSDGNVHGLTVFTRSINQDLLAIFDSINIFIIIMIGFSLGMGFIILLIMSQNALMEQKRPLSVFRSIGFTIGDISRIWTLQSVMEFLLSAIFAIPVGVLVSMLLFKLCSSVTQVYPFVFSWQIIALALGFVLLVIVICHLLTMLSIKKWNLADETRSRE